MVVDPVELNAAYVGDVAVAIRTVAVSVAGKVVKDVQIVGTAMRVFVEEIVLVRHRLVALKGVVFVDLLRVAAPLTVPDFVSRVLVVVSIVVEVVAEVSEQMDG